jgi:LPS-assembly protein
VRRFLPFAVCLSLLLTPRAYGQTGGTCAQLTDSLPELEFSADPELELTADTVDASADGLSRLLGSVRLRQGDKELTADQLDFDENEHSVQIHAESLFRNRELTIRSDSAEFDLDDETGVFNGTEFVLPQRAARGDSREIHLSRAGTADLNGVRYTTCAPDSNAWYLEAGSIHLDHAEGLGTARNARLRLMGVPIFYAPWFQFPIDDRRRTGLLFPTIGRSDRTGWDFRQPIYLNLAPNYDATLTPRYMSDRGVQINGEGRYLLPRAEGSMGYEYLEDDNQTGETRAYGFFNHRGLISRRLGADIRFAETSDRSYFEDFGGNIDLSAITHLERSARFTYAAPAAYTVQMLLQDYQTIASNLATADDPYQRLPQVRFDAITRNALWDTRAGVEGEYVNFARDNSTEGQRIDLHPFLRMEKDWLAWFVKSQVDFRYTAYQLANESALQSQNPDRSLYSYSAEYGLRFERITGSGAVQTLEPHVFYLYTPYDDQDDLPIFDSGEPDFDFTQLFARNRYSGADRISDANHMAIALTGRHLDPQTGAERISASIGQLFRFEAPQVQLPDDSSPQQGATDFIGSLDYSLSQSLSFGVDTQWSPENAEFSRSSVAMRYHSGLRTLQLAYRYRVGLLEQTDILLATPLYNGVSLLGRWRYSLSDRQSLDTVAGLQYETCCWGVQASYRRYVSNTAGDFNSGVYLQLELKGLARVGTGLQNLLPRDAVE